MKLLILSENNDLKANFEPYFEEVKQNKISETRINLIEDEGTILADNKNLAEFDCSIIIPEPELTIFTKVLLENLEKDLVNTLDSTSSYILAKKQYLYKVLNEKGISIPKTIAIGSEKGVSGIKEPEFPVVGRKFRGFKKREMSLLENMEQVNNFSNPLEYGKESVIIQEYVEGEVFDLLVIGNEVISIQLTNKDRWDPRARKSNEKFYNVSSEVKELAVKARKAIGAKVVRTKIVGDKIVNISSKPQLDRFKNISGKNTYKKISKILKEEI